MQDAGFQIPGLAKLGAGHPKDFEWATLPRGRAFPLGRRVWVMEEIILLALLGVGLALGSVFTLVAATTRLLVHIRKLPVFHQYPPWGHLRTMMAGIYGK